MMACSDQHVLVTQHLKGYHVNWADIQSCHFSYTFLFYVILFSSRLREAHTLAQICILRAQCKTVASYEDPQSTAARQSFHQITYVVKTTARSLKLSCSQNRNPKAAPCIMDFQQSSMFLLNKKIEPLFFFCPFFHYLAWTQQDLTAPLLLVRHFFVVKEPRLCWRDQDCLENIVCSHYRKSQIKRDAFLVDLK